MLSVNATDVRKNWSAVSESVIREKPVFIKKTRDYMMLSNTEFLNMLLSGYQYTAQKFKEEDGSITLSLCELDLVENAETEEKALQLLAVSILEYASDFYQEFHLWATAPNKKKEIPYVFKALALDDTEKIKECIQCRAGKN